MKPLARLMLPAASAWLGACAAVEPDGARVADARVTEASGIAASPGRPELLWMLNDSGGAPELHLIEPTGAARGTLRVEGVRNVDWEDLASFRWRGRAWLLVGDIGDNAAIRKTVRLHLVAEPPLPETGRLMATVRPEWTLEFRYQDGPRDCEGLAVDVAQESILLLSKRDRPPRLYRLPLASPADGVAVATLLGEAVSPAPPPGAWPHPFGHQPTALDIAPDGRSAALATYLGAYRIDRAPHESWAEAFAREPRLLARHGLAQAEALAFRRDGRSVVLSSEGAHPPLVVLPAAPTPSP